MQYEVAGDAVVSTIPLGVLKAVRVPGLFSSSLSSSSSSSSLSSSSSSSVSLRNQECRAGCANVALLLTGSCFDVCVCV